MDKGALKKNYIFGGVCLLFNYIVIVLIFFNTLRYGSYLFSGDVSIYYLMMFIIKLLLIIAFTVFRNQLFKKKDTVEG